MPRANISLLKNLTISILPYERFKYYYEYILHALNGQED